MDGCLNTWKSRKMAGWVMAGWKEEGQVDKGQACGMMSGRGERACAQGATPALPEPLGLGEFPRQVLALRVTGKGLAGHGAPST